MFREPLRRDPLVVGWALVMAFAAFLALSNNTTWSGHLEADRVLGFLKDLADAFLWSFLVLLLLAWLRSRRWRGNPSVSRPWGARPRVAAKPASDPFQPYPWTDRWLRDWREADAKQATLVPGRRRATGGP
jgi:hypothetical protein